MSDTLVDSFKKLSVNPDNAKNIINSDDNFNTINCVDFNYYFQQLKSVVENAQQSIKDYSETNMGISAPISDAIGVVLPIILILLVLYVMVRFIVKQIKLFLFLFLLILAIYLILTYA